MEKKIKKNEKKIKKIVFVNKIFNNGKKSTKYW